MVACESTNLVTYECSADKEQSLAARCTNRVGFTAMMACMRLPLGLLVALMSSRSIGGYRAGPQHFQLPPWKGLPSGGCPGIGVQHLCLRRTAHTLQQ